MKNKAKNKIRSKKGMTLVEIVVGISLVVIVFASCLGAMVGGYTTTIYNSDENRVAVLNGSLNEIIVSTIHNYGPVNSESVERLVGGATSPLNPAIKDNVEFDDSRLGTTTSATYVKPEDFASPDQTKYPGKDLSIRYTLVPGTRSDLVVSDTPGNTKTVQVTGVWIRTCFEAARGPIFYESFVPYKV